MYIIYYFWLLIQKDEKYGIQNTNMKKRFDAY